MTRFLSQGYKVNRLSITFKKFYGRHMNFNWTIQKKSAKCLLILSVEIIFIFDGFAEWPN